MLTHPHEAWIALETIQIVLDAQVAMFHQYDVGGLQFIAIIFPSMAGNVDGRFAEVHECQILESGDKERAIRALEKICNKLWRGPGCQWQGIKEA